MAKSDSSPPVTQQDLTEDQTEKPAEKVVSRKLVEDLVKRAWEGYDLYEFKELLTNYPHLVNEHSSRGQTALYCASRNNQFEFVVELLKIPGIDINIVTQDNWRSTALHAACHAGHCDIVALLIFNGANIDVLNNAGNPPFKEATKEVKIVFEHYEKFGKQGLKVKYLDKK